MKSLAHRGGAWNFKTHQWVPDEYEHLERLGLVHCVFGHRDFFNPSLRERNITLTKMGEFVAGELGDVDVPARVNYSFHAALTA